MTSATGARHRGPQFRPPRQHAGATLHSYTASDRVDIVLTNPPFGGREEDGIESNFPTHFRTKETADLFLALIVRLLKRAGALPLCCLTGPCSGRA